MATSFLFLKICPCPLGVLYWHTPPFSCVLGYICGQNAETDDTVGIVCYVTDNNHLHDNCVQRHWGKTSVAFSAVFWRFGIKISLDTPYSHLDRLVSWLFHLPLHFAIGFCPIYCRFTHIKREYRKCVLHVLLNPTLSFASIFLIFV